MATVMTANRVRVAIDAAWMQANASLLFYTQASDGVWVPRCDLVQYEAGRRPFRA
jgi:hypothetical protein